MRLNYDAKDVTLDDIVRYIYRQTDLKLTQTQIKSLLVLEQKAILEALRNDQTIKWGVIAKLKLHKVLVSRRYDIHRKDFVPSSLTLKVKFKPLQGLKQVLNDLKKADI